MATRKKRRQRTTQLLAASALLSSVVAPYVIQADEFSNVTNEHDTATQNAEQFPNTTVHNSSTTADSSTVTTGDTGHITPLPTDPAIDAGNGATTVDTAQLTAFDQLTPGSYHIGFSAGIKDVEKNKNKYAYLFALASNMNALPAQVEVTADKTYRVTLNINRNNSSSVNNLVFTQQGQTIDYEIVSSIKKSDGTVIPNVVTFTVNTLNESVAFANGNIAGTLTFDETAITASEQEVLPNLAALQNGIYEIELEDWSYSSKGGWQRPVLNTATTISPTGKLEVNNGKYYVTAQFNGRDYSSTGTTEYNYYVYKVKSSVQPWASTSYTDGLLLEFDKDTQTSTFKFEIQDPFAYNTIQPHRLDYNVTPEKDGGYASLYVHIKPDSLKKIGEVEALPAGNYITNIYHKNGATNASLTKLATSLGQQANVQLKADGSAIITMAALDYDLADYQITKVDSPYLTAQLKDDAGYTYALQFEVPSLDTQLKLDISVLNKTTKTEDVFENAYLEVNQVALKLTDEPLQFQPKELYTPFEFPYEDGEYSIDVRLLTDNKTTPVTKDSEASKHIALDNTKITVKDGDITFSGTLKDVSTWLYSTNLEIEDQYGSYTYSPINVIKGIDKETGNFSQEISFKMNDLTGLSRLRFNLKSQDKDQNSGTGIITRVSADVNSITPYIAPEDAGTELPYTIIPDSTDEMGAFVVNYLSPYFEKPAKLKIEDGIPYAYITVSGKMYIADTDKFRYVAADGSEQPVEVVYNNGKTGLELVRTVKFPIHQQQMKLFVNGGSYGEYYLYTDFAIDESLLPKANPGDDGSTGETPTPNPGDSQTTPDSGGVDTGTTPDSGGIDVGAPDSKQENIFFLTEYSNSAYGTFIGSTIQSADLVTRNGEQFAHVLVKPSTTAKLDENGNYTVVETLEDGTVKLEIKLTDHKATIPFLIMSKTAASATLVFPAPLTGTVIEEDRPFAITDISNTHYAKIYAAATEKIDVIEKADGQYARIFYSTNYPTFQTIKSGTVASFTESTRIIEVKLDEAFNATVTFANATGNLTHTVTYNVREEIEKESLPAHYEGIASYLDVEEKTDVRFKYADDTDQEAIKALEQSVVIKPYVNRVEQQIQYGMKFEANEQLTKIELYNGNIRAHGWTAEEELAQETLVNGALDKLSFKLTFADGTEKTVKVAAIVPGSFGDVDEEPTNPVDPNTPINVTHSFTAVEVQAGTFGSVPGSFIENYLKPYFTNAQLVTIDNKKYIELTLVGKAYGVVSFEGAEIVSSTGEKLEQVRVIRIPAAKVSTHRVDAGDYGIYDLTFKFDVTDEQLVTPVDPEPEQPTNPVNPEPEQPTNPVDPEPAQPTGPISVTHSFTAVEVQAGTFGSVPGSFIENYLKPYFTNAQLVTVNNKKYIELTLVGKAYGVVSFEGSELVSSTGEKLEQVRVIRIPAAKVSTHRVNAGEYGIYDLTFTFGVTDEQLVVEEPSTTPTTPEQPVEKPVENVIAPPTKPSNDKNAIIKKPSELKVEKNKEIDITFNFETPTKLEEQQVINTLKEMIAKPTIKVTDNNKFEVKIPITPKTGVKKIRVLKDGKELGVWTAPTTTARIASLFPFFASNSNEITFETDSLEGITFEAIDTNDKAVSAKPAVEVDKTIAVVEETNTTPGTVTGGTGGGSVVTVPVASDAESRESINYKMVGDPNGPMEAFMTNYMTPYFSNAELVTVGGKNYIEMTLTGKAYGFQNLRVTGGYTTISSVGEKMDQVRVIRFPAAKEVTIHVDSGDLGYGAYDLLFTFELSEEQLKNAAAAGTGGITTVQTITPQIVSEGDVKFTIPAEASAIVTYAKKISAKLVDGKYNVAVTLMTETDLQTFVVKQGEQEIARWDKKAKSAALTTVANNNVLSFTVESLDDLTFIATTKTRTLEAKIGAELPKQPEVEQTSKDGRQSMTYTMEADPNGPMADFIGNYLAPYFSNAVYVLEDGKEYVELTLTGKAYGFAKLQYIDADGNYVDIDVLSSTGEKMDQVRVIRLPLVQDKDGITKIFVDSGDLGYGAYTLFFRFNVPAQSGNTAATITNPFKDIDNIYSKDDVLALYAAGITTGTSETTFSPNANMTRAQFAVMVARALGVSSSKATQFKDVQGKWYAAEVQALAEIGIITGVSETKFKPGDKITRQQAAVIIHRLLKYKGYTNTTTAEALNFKDNAKVADYAKEALAELQAQGIMTGSEGKVNPKANLTRAQMAKILKNAADLVGLLD